MDDEFTKRRLKKNPMTYWVEIEHTELEMAFTVHDVQEDQRSKSAVADDLERAAKMLRNSYDVKTNQSPEED